MKQIQLGEGMFYVTNDTVVDMFRILSPEEETDFRSGADELPEGTSINPTWHPAFQDQLFLNGKGVEGGSHV